MVMSKSREHFMFHNHIMHSAARWRIAGLYFAGDTTQIDQRFVFFRTIGRQPLCSPHGQSTCLRQTICRVVSSRQGKRRSEMTPQVVGQINVTSGLEGPAIPLHTTSTALANLRHQASCPSRDPITSACYDVRLGMT
jgi:hypothetical protein